MSLNKLGPATASAAGGGGGWTPASHANGLVWWKADLGVATTGSDVDSWTDQISGLIGTPPATAPTFVSSSLNGLPGIDFGGNSKLHVPANAAINNIWLKGSEVYMWIVITFNAVTGRYRFLDKGKDVSGSWRLIMNGAESNQMEFEIVGTGGDQTLDSTETFTATSFTIEVSWDGDLTVQPDFRIDNVVGSWTIADTGVNPMRDDSAIPMAIGGQQPNTTGQLDGLIHEFWFAQDPSGAEITNARNYASTRWGTF